MKKPYISLKSIIEDSEDIKSLTALASLPLCHTVKNPAEFQRIMMDGKLKRTICDEFNEDLIYLFYGKPSYTDRDNLKDEKSLNCPFIISFDLSIIDSNVKRMYPFDSGGFKRYKIAGGFQLKDFEIENPTIKQLKTYILKFFNSNVNYFNSNMTVNPSDYPTCLVLKSLLNHYKNNASTEFGEQGFSIELHLSETDLDLSPTEVCMPASYINTDVARAEWSKIFPNTYLIPYNDSNNSQTFLYVEMIKAMNNHIQDKYN